MQIDIKDAFKLAQSYHEKNDLTQAEQIYKTIISMDPMHAGAYHNLGLVYAMRGSAEPAIENIKKAVEIDRNNPTFHNNLGELYRKTGQLEFAEFHLGAAVELNPAHSDAFSNLGLVYAAKGDNDSAKLCFANALEANPKNTSALINTGNLLKSEKLHQDAAECYEAVIAISPDNPAALKAATYNYLEAGDYNSAAKYCSRLVNGRPEMHKERVLLALITLRNKDFRKGFQLLESRLKFQDIMQGDQETLWRGDNLKGKTLYIYSEVEGSAFDETILVSRYIFDLEKYEPEKIILKVQPEIKKLIEMNVPDFVEVTDENITEFDTHSPIMSLPLVLNARAKTIPKAEGWLQTDPEKDKKFAEIMATDKKKIGIVCSSPDSANIVDIDAFSEILNNENYSVYLLGSAPKGELPKSITDLNEHISDFSDTASAIKNLDMLIAADSPEVHIAGGLGIKTSLLLAPMHNWQWFTAKTSKVCEWYSSVTFYMKEKDMTWKDVVSSIEC